MQGKRRPAWGKIIAVLIVLVALGAAWRYTPLKDYVTAARVSGCVKSRWMSKTCGARRS